MFKIARNILQRNIHNGKNIWHICIAPQFIKLNRDMFKKYDDFHGICIHNNSYVRKKSIIANIYKPDFNEYLFYTPVTGIVTNINYDLLEGNISEKLINVNNIIGCNDDEFMIDNLRICDIEVNKEEFNKPITVSIIGKPLHKFYDDDGSESLAKFNGYY